MVSLHFYVFCIVAGFCFYFRAVMGYTLLGLERINISNVLSHWRYLIYLALRAVMGWLEILLALKPSRLFGWLPGAGPCGG